MRIRYSPVALQLGDVPVGKLGSCFNWENRKDFPPLASTPWACLEPTSGTGARVPEKSVDSPSEMSDSAAEEVIIASEDVAAQEIASMDTSTVSESVSEKLVASAETVVHQEIELPMEPPTAQARDADVRTSEPIVANDEPLTLTVGDQADSRMIPKESDRSELLAEEEKREIASAMRDVSATKPTQSSSGTTASTKAEIEPKRIVAPVVDIHPATPVNKPDSSRAKVSQQFPRPSGMESQPPQPFPSAVPPLQPFIASGGEPTADYLASLERLVLQLNYELGVVTGKADSERWMMQRLIEVNLQNLALQEKLRAITSQ